MKRARVGRILFYLASAMVVAGLSSMRSGTPEDDYQEECLSEGCSTEEVRELHASYVEECINEGCSKEEIRELAGSDTAAPQMFEDFQRRGWQVRPEDATANSCQHIRTRTACVLVTLWCLDECRFPDGSLGGRGWYICGGCFGFDW